jgi:hypothetical protein
VRPTEHTEYTEEFEQEGTERTEDGRLTEDWPQKSARGAKIRVGGCHRGHGARTQRRKETNRVSHRADPSLGSTSVFLLCQRLDEDFTGVEPS